MKKTGYPEHHTVSTAKCNPDVITGQLLGKTNRASLKCGLKQTCSLSKKEEM